MQSVLVVHIVAGSLGLVSGFVALYATKGAPLHRRAGTVFFCVMLAMCFFGGLIAAVQGVEPALNLPAALITAYLVITGWTTVRPPTPASRRLTFAAMLVGLGVGLVCLTFGFDALALGGRRNNMPAFPFFLFGLLGLLGSVGDLRLLRAGAIRGAPRIARHLWRMCSALIIAALSFFIGQADEFPKALRIPALLALPMLSVLVTMLYWLWRVRIRRTAQPRADSALAVPAGAGNQ